MPAPFAKSLVGYRNDGKPNTCDASDRFSVELGEALLDAMAVTRDVRRAEPTGLPFATALASDLDVELSAAGSDLQVVPERALKTFEQFAHVGAAKAFSVEPSKFYTQAWAKLQRYVRNENVGASERVVRRLDELFGAVDAAVQAEVETRRALVEAIGSESLLKLDVTAARRRPGADAEVLEVGLSLKWSLRTDRAQDCRSQGSKMSALRRGRMPHFAAVTMEPRPYMLNLLGGGSGEIDCVYHLDLAALENAIDRTCRGNTRRRETLDLFRRLVKQRRVRDYDELVSYVKSL